LKGYDYSQPGGYYVTIVTQNRECLFGDIVDGKMILNEYGLIVETVWNDLPNHYNHIKLNEYVIMPNHVHGIVIINDVGAGFKPAPTIKHGLPEIIRGFKTFSARRINKYRNTPGQKLWQRNYWEHVIRDENELNRIREYIMNNPLQWELDEENPKKIVDKKRFDKIKFEEHQCRKTI
jgi:REP element-mobilizing transposase RayT